MSGKLVKLEENSFILLIHQTQSNNNITLLVYGPKESQKIRNEELFSSCITFITQSTFSSVIIYLYMYILNISDGDISYSHFRVLTESYCIRNQVIKGANTMQYFLI